MRHSTGRGSIGVVGTDSVDAGSSRSWRTLRLAGIALVFVAVLAAGCGPVPGPKTEQPAKPSESGPALTTAKGVSEAASTLADKMSETKSIGESGGETGWAVVGRIDGVASAVATITKDVTAAEKYLADAKQSPETSAALGRLTELRKAINKCNESLALTRIVAVGDIAVTQANAGVESASNAVSAANDSEYSKALASAKDAKKKLATAQKMFTELAGQYPGAGFQNDVSYCKASVKLADIGVELTTLGKAGKISAYNNLVDKANKQLDTVRKMTNPVDRMNKVGDDSATVYNDALAMVRKVQSDNAK